MNQNTAEHIDVNYVAELARMHLTEDEKQRFQSQLDEVLAYVDKLKQLDVGNIEPMAHAVPVENVFREDEAVHKEMHDRVMANAPAERNGTIQVPAIIE